ncbi:hypothetical protein CPE01_01250 [Cellulomonas persica]|uniref:G domain-containing protein n=1 Tax=Cellulomonas persica TaxID=76861 RepID=A0A510UP18_9CELL|nr:hypothetical protein CPE01_01250 [Cellulomonas persica]
MTVGEETRALQARVSALEDALELGGTRLDPDGADEARAAIARLRERLALGVDHTVVALAGGTGSGKSSLFNRVSGLQFAEVGVRRPTSSQVTACVWGPGGADVLDWLGVHPDLRIQRESLLDGETEAPLRGLVLLDLPDHDSVEPAHRAVVDRLLPQADLLVWVVDPQKYADEALHAGYLRALAGQDTSMLVVLNQVDTVRPQEREPLLADVARLLADDGLPDVPVVAASAVTDEGIRELRAGLAAVVAERSLAARRAEQEVTATARRLTEGVAPREPAPAALATGPIVASLAEASGMDAVTDAVAAAVRGRGVRVPQIVPVHPDAVRLARDSWLAGATADLPARWAGAVRERVAGAQDLGRHLGEALGDVTVTVRRSRAAAVLGVVAGVLGLAALVVGGIGMGELVGGRGVGVALEVGIGCAIVAAVCFVVSRVVRNRAAQRSSQRVRDEGRAAIEAVARRDLVQPAAEVVGEHRKVRGLLEAARG